MKGMSGAFPGWVRAPNGRRRTSQSPEHTDLGSGLRAFKGRIVRVNNRFPAASQPTNLGDDLLEEVRKSLKRLKVLEGLKADRDPILTPITTPDDDPPEPSAPEKEDYGSPVAPPSKVIATLLVTLVIASSLGWVLFLSHPGTVPRNAFDVLGPRWKDESATHFTFAASADFGGLDNGDSMALAIRARTAGISFLLALGDLGDTTDEAAWCSQMKRVMPELVIVPGTHDMGGSGGGNISRYVKNCPYPLSSAVMPGPGTPGYGFEYYFDYPTETPLARFIMISPGLGGGLKYNYSEESAHTEWIEDVVDNARDQRIPWVIVGGHADCITVGRKDRCSMGQELFDEIVGAKVDLILAGHDHAYARSKQLKESDSCKSVNSTGPVQPSCIVEDGLHGAYPKGNGTVVITQGVGGDDLDNVVLNDTDPQVRYFVEAMGQNANTEGALPGFGSVFYTVTANSISARTDFCLPGSVSPDGQCTADTGRVFTDRFSISDRVGDPGLSPAGGSDPQAPNALNEYSLLVDALVQRMSLPESWQSFVAREEPRQ